ncbi:hypothetical protein [Nannocystis pusilla]|uniref:hypothetical protein n=1 Tax=Nannocystis pusilla TaxID=889268 RepID=UPI003B7DADC0
MPGPVGSMRELAAEPPRNHLAGPERWRSKVYGSDTARALGLTLLPTLISQDIYAEGDELDVLEREVEVLLGNTGRWPALGLDELRFHLLNIIEAIRLARTDAHGGVYIG